MTPRPWLRSPLRWTRACTNRYWRASSEVMKLSLTGNQMTDAQRTRLVEVSSEVEGEFNRYRPQVDGRQLNENQIVEVLRTSDDQELRQRTYSASKEIGHRVSGRVRELARLRNAVALKLGFADFYTMSLELQQLSEDWLFRLFGELDELYQRAVPAMEDLPRRDPAPPVRNHRAVPLALSRSFLPTPAAGHRSYFRRAAQAPAGRRSFRCGRSIGGASTSGPCSR